MILRTVLTLNCILGRHHLGTFERYFCKALAWRVS